MATGTTVPAVQVAAAVAAAVPAIPPDVATYVQPLVTALDAVLAFATVLLTALAVAVWLLLRRVRSQHRWQVAYWHLAATARCSLCGSQMERPPATGIQADALRAAPPTPCGHL